MPLGTEKNSLLGAAGAGSDGNYFGDGSDGALTTSGNVTYTTLNKNGSFDADMVVKNYTSLTISSGHLITTDQPCRGLLIYVKGDCTITGTLSMSGRGALANPTVSGGSDSAAVNANGIQLPMFKTGGTDTLAAATFAGCGNAAVTAVANQPGIDDSDDALEGTIFSIVRTGASAGTGVMAAQHGATGGSGSAGTTGQKSIQTGGGGAGGGFQYGTGGPGGSATCFSGGSGGGGGGLATGQAGVDYGGAGGAGMGSTFGPPPPPSDSAGGAGNPGGAGAHSGGSGDSGIGGLLMLVVGGDLTMTGSVTCQGKTGGQGGSEYGPNGGGGSGGGALMIIYAGTLSNSISPNCLGGSAGSPYGGAGGNGGVHIIQVNEA